MRPTLEQIESFSLQVIDTTRIQSFFKSGKLREYETPAKRKRYNKEIVLFVCADLYGYSYVELEYYFKLSKGRISNALSSVRSSFSKKETAEELYESLNILYGVKKKVDLNTYINRILPIFANENNVNTRSINDLSNLEMWLIKRLHEQEN
jgi:hypothetical protein